MKNPGWPVLVVALLLGLVTGDFVVTAHSQQLHPSKQEVTDTTQAQSPLSWQGEYDFFGK